MSVTLFHFWVFLFYLYENFLPGTAYPADIPKWGFFVLIFEGIRSDWVDIPNESFDDRERIGIELFRGNLDVSPFINEARITLKMHSIDSMISLQGLADSLRVFFINITERDVYME